jgi:hypothetical protein
MHTYRLCCLALTVFGYRSRGPGSIPDATRFFLEVVGLERGALSLVSTTEELLRRKSSCSGQENRDYSLKDPPRWPRHTSLSLSLSLSLSPLKLALTSPTSGGSSVSIVLSRTKARDLLLLMHTWKDYMKLVLEKNVCWWLAVVSIRKGICRRSAE